MCRFIKRIVIYLLLMLLASLCFVIVLAVTNQIMTSFEKHHYKAPGKLIQINQSMMHVYTIGNGTDNIILLSGLGTASPIYDFAPLIQRLKDSYRVTVVERFGYGWSEGSTTPRSNEAIVEEMRLALRQTGILPPYILVPHSIAGLYTLYYANKYPNEVKAIIGLDTSVPEQAKLKKYPRKTNINNLLRITGTARILFSLKPRMLGNYEIPEYSKNDRKMLKIFACWNFGNPTIWNEEKAVTENCKNLYNRTYPNDIPVTLILSNTTVQSSKSNPSWLKMHENQIQGKPYNELVILDGYHYIHWNNSKQIADIITKTISKKK